MARPRHPSGSAAHSLSPFARLPGSQSKSRPLGRSCTCTQLVAAADFKSAASSRSSHEGKKDGRSGRNCTRDIRLMKPTFCFLNYGAKSGAAPGTCTPLCRLRVGDIAVYACAAKVTEAGGHAPQAGNSSPISLAMSPGSLVRFGFQKRKMVSTQGIAP